MNFIKIFILSAISLLPTIANAAIAVKSQPPIIYTGITHYSKDGADINVVTRLSLLHISSNPAGGENYRATVIYYLGDDASNEYTSHTYEQITTISPITRTMEIIPRLSPRFPKISLKFNETFDHAEGTGELVATGQRGEYVLNKGWDYDQSVQTESRYGGIYSISCPLTTRVNLATAKRVIISPTRLVVPMANVGPVDSDLHYIGNVGSSYSAPPGQLNNSATFQSGTVQIFQRLLTLQESRNNWICDRQSTGDLKCGSLLYGQCVLKKTAEIHTSMTDRFPMPTVPVLAKKEVSPSLPECGEAWNRTYHGYLHHRIGDRRQPLSITMSTLKHLDEYGNTLCDLSLSAHLSFFAAGVSLDSSRQFSNGEIVYQFPIIPIDVTRPELIMESQSPREISLTIRSDGNGGFGFDWFSRIYGFVGEIIVSDIPGDPDVARIDSLKSIYGLTGFFESEHRGNLFEFLDIRAEVKPSTLAEMMFNPNPYSGVQLVGWELHRDQTRAIEDEPFKYPIGSDVYFDYYTNFFAINTGLNFIVGEVLPDGLTTRSVKFAAASAVDFNMAPRKWSRVKMRQDLLSEFTAVGQTPAEAGVGGPAQFFLWLFAKEPDIKRITIFGSGAFMSTTPRGPSGDWGSTFYATVPKDMYEANTVKVIIRYNDERVIQMELPVKRP